MDLSCLKEKREREDNLIVQNSAVAAFSCNFNCVDNFWPVTLLQNSDNLNNGHAIDSGTSPLLFCLQSD